MTKTTALTKEQKIDLAKNVTGVVTSIGVGHVVSGIISTNVPTENMWQVAARFVGKTVISSMACEAAKRHTDGTIDNMVAWWDENVTQVDDMSEV